MIKYLRIEYLFIFMVLIWVPFQQFILKVDGAANTIALLATMILAKTFTKKTLYKTTLKKPLVIWATWVIYAFINTVSKGLDSELNTSTFFLNIFIPLLLMIIISTEFKRNQKDLINVLIFGSYFSVLIILFFISENDKGRMGGEMNSNTIGTMATILCMLLYLKYHKNYLKTVWFFLLIPVPIYTVISTGSRTAFGGIALLVALHFFLNRSRHPILTIAKIGLGVMALTIPFNYLLQETSLGERIMDTTEQTQGKSFETGNEVLDKFGDRGFFYSQGWNVFKEYPISGIGLGNFKDYNYLRLAQHSEYMIQLTELGLIGFIIFFLFYFSIFKNLKLIKKSQKKSSNNKEIELYIGYVLIILIMITATRMYRVWYFFTIIGFVIGYINFNKSQIQKNNY